MTDNRNPMRYKNLFSWFKSGTSSNVSENEREEENMDNEIVNEREEENKDHEIVNEMEEKTVNDNLSPSSSIPLHDQHFDINSLERDPGKRHPIEKYPLNDRDNIRRAYVVHGPYQPRLSSYPSTSKGGQGRRFCYTWFKEWPWLEYSIEEDKPYCFPCFLFDSCPSRHPSFTEIGFNGWKNVMTRQSGIRYHVGGITFIHSGSMHKWENLRNPSKHIEKVIFKLSSQEVANNRNRLVATIEVVRLLARQGCSFRGNDESVDSLNGGNFDAVLDSFKRMNVEVHKVIESAPGNAKYTSPKIQKQIANILGNKVRAKIRAEVGESKFCILVDEALDVSNKEQMAIILRFVDCEGFIRERFFKVISVVDTCSQTLKDEISRVLAQYNLQIENMCGQGYDGASNMRGKFNGLQALFLRECSYAYYVHCFAHRLQLTLNASAKGVHDVWQFFSTLTMIVNFVDSSAKRHSMLKAFKEVEISDLVALGTIETGSGMNQACTLQRAGATRWGSHLRSISSLIKLFGATRTTIDDLNLHGVDKVQGEAKAIGKALEQFDFVYCLLLMHDIMRITDFLCQALQKRDIDILSALHFLSLTKKKLQAIRENGWDDLINKIRVFCCEHDISMPDMSAPYKKSLRKCEQNITNEHYYRINILNNMIDFQLAELDSRFPESSLELLVLSASFDPRDNYRAFKPKDVCKLASKFYPTDFSSHDMFALDLECGFFVSDIPIDSRFAKATSVFDLCQRLVLFGKSSFYPMIYRLICLILTLPVSTATTERLFSSMNIIKNKLRNKMNDEFLDDFMVLYIERSIADSIDNDDVIVEFEKRGPRRIKFT